MFARVGILLVVIGGLLIPTSASAQLMSGSSPEFKFETPLVNGMGTASLADLQGSLVWVEFWGTY